ncbi:MAG: hypothetical protein ACRDJ4_04640 [Actinomycetota bacterium]
MKKLLKRLFGGPSREEVERQAQEELDALAVSGPEAGSEDEWRASPDHPSLQTGQRRDR